MAQRMDRKTFVNYIVNLVLTHRKASKVKPDFYDSVTIAQAIHETGYGTSDLYLAFNNSFGYKAKKGEWSGKIAADYKSDEEVNGIKIKDVASDFRAYDSVADSVKDHANMMSSRGEGYKVVYKKALEAKTPDIQAHALTKTYAGDSKYGEKLINVMKEWNLYQYDDAKVLDAIKVDNTTKTEGKDTTMVEKPRTRIKKHTLVNMGGTLSNPRFIVIHFVGASGQALANANYFYNVMRSASAHIFIDKDVTYEVVPENRVAWHIGDGASSKKGSANGYVIPGMATNNNALGIEGCQDTSTGNNVWEWQFHANTYKQMLLETSAWMDKYNIPIDRVIRHYDASNKTCPGNWQYNNWAKWWKFKEDLKQLRAGKSVVSTPTQKEDTGNPQGFQQQDVPEYRAPKNEFKAMNKGDEVTYRSSFSWYNIQSNKWIVSPNIPKTWINTKDKIVDIKEVSASYSKRAYLMEKSKSWVLEQDLQETRSHWEESSTNTYTVKHGDYLYKIAEEFKITVDQLKEWNHLESNLITTGMKLFVVEPFGYIPKDESPTSTEDVSDVVEVTDEENKVEDKGDKTPAIELKENQVLTWDGRILEIKDITK